MHLVRFIDPSLVAWEQVSVAPVMFSLFSDIILGIYAS
jgi:hypothetical protein